MKLKFLALCLVIALMVTMLSSCEILKFTNHMLNIFGPDDKNEVNLDLDIVIPGNNSGNGNGNTEHVHNWITIPGKPSTCTVSGYSDKVVCDTCGEVRVESTKLVLAPHTYDDSSDRICNVCAYTRNCTHAQTTVIPGYSATIDATGLTDGKRCNFCGETVVPQFTIHVLGTYGLTYELNEEKTGYIVTGLGSATDTTLTIGGLYNGLPVVAIGDSAFCNRESITSVVMSNNIISIGHDAFYGCSNLTNIIIGDGVTKIGEDAFWGCSKLADVTIGKCVEAIDGYAFTGCYGLTNIVIPDSVISIGAAAFWYCNNLTSVTIGNSVTSIGGAAFQDCSSLKSIVIPDSVTSIGDGAFENCSSLESAIIGNGVTKITYEMFGYCSSLTSVTLGNKVAAVVSYAFTHCTSLTNITYGGTVAQWNISKYGNWDAVTGNYTVYCTDGTIAKDGTVTYN